MALVLAASMWPTWLDADISIVAGLVLLTFALGWVSMESTYKPPTPGRVRLFRTLTIVLGLGMVFLAIVQATRAKRSDAKRDSRIDELTGITGEMRDRLLHPNSSEADMQILAALGKMNTRLGIKQPPIATVGAVKPSDAGEHVVPVTALTKQE